MRIIADTNVLVRAAVRDNPAQAQQAIDELSRAECVAVSLPALCEFVWVLSSSYKQNSAEIAQSIRDLIGSANVSTNLDAAEAGLLFMDAGGDFADGVIIHEGQSLGGDEFVSFDKKAIKQAVRQNRKARLLS